jgi:hypothetical protein
MMWETDWESVDIDWQDPAIAEMFYKAWMERVFNFDPPPYLDNMHTGSEAFSVDNFWLNMVSRCHQLGGATYVTDDFDGHKPEHWFDKYGVKNWPPDNGFRRIYRRTIVALDDPGEEGWIARLEMNRFNVNAKLTPAIERKLSGRNFQYTEGKWIETEEQGDILHKFGLPKPGDFLGGHILNDCKKCIDLATIYTSTLSGWTSRFENTIRYGYATSFAFRGMTDAEIQEGINLAKQQALDMYNNMVPQPHDHRDLLSGGASFTAIFVDPSLFVFELSANNSHGIATLENIDGQHVRFWGAGSKTPSAPVKLTAYENLGDIIFDEEKSKTLSSTITDGEGKSIRVIRKWEPLEGVGFEVLWQKYPNTTFEVIGESIRATTIFDDEDAQNPITKVGMNLEPVSLSSTPLVMTDGQGQVTEVLARVRRLGVGSIRNDSTFDCKFDILRDIQVVPSQIQESNNASIATRTPTIVSAIFPRIERSTTFINGYFAVVLRLYGYPYMTGHNGGKALKRKATLYLHNPNPVGEFDNFGEVFVAQPTIFKKHGQPVETSDFEIQWPKVGSLGAAPPWPVTSTSRGFNSLGDVVALNYDVNGGFKYRKGYTGQ